MSFFVFADYCCVVYLTDPSFDSPDDKLSCNIFKLKEADLPQVDIGDIVRFHRLKVGCSEGVAAVLSFKVYI